MASKTFVLGAGYSVATGFPLVRNLRSEVLEFAQTTTDPLLRMTGDDIMELLTAEMRARLLENGRQNAEGIAVEGNTIDFHPVVKLFTPDPACTWLLSEIDPEEPDIAFGLCDLGMGCPELGSVQSFRNCGCARQAGPERDLYFKANKPLSAYADEAHRLGHIRA
jgi:hypothetical protein